MDLHAVLSNLFLLLYKNVQNEDDTSKRIAVYEELLSKKCSALTHSVKDTNKQMV